jgi:glycosyltransferase involved in cell wall biosynthesis
VKLLFITKTRSGYGSHVILTNLVTQLRLLSVPTDVFVIEHPKEQSRWSEFSDLWTDINPKILAFNHAGALVLANPDTFSYYDEVLLDDKLAINKIKTLANDTQYSHVILDSWYVTHTGIKANVHNYKNVFQFIQSEPEFQPESAAKLWKAALFELLPYVYTKKIFLSPTHAHNFELAHKLRYPSVGFFVSDAFLVQKFTVQDIKNGEYLRIVTISSNYNIPSKGLDSLLSALTTVHKDHFPVELTIICSVPILKDIKAPFKITIIFDAINPHARARHLSENDLYITTTTNESPGLAQTEALAVGLPSLAFDSHGNRDYYQDNNFIMVKDEADLVKEIIRYKDTNLRTRLSENAKASMRQYSLEKFTQKFINILDTYKAPDI